MCWWRKTLFFHLIDIAVVNSYILFQEYRTNCPDESALKQPPTYSLVNFREEVLRGLCGFPEYGPPPGQATPKPAPPSPDAPWFVTEHIPCFSEERRACVVCWHKEKKQYKVQTSRKVPQCNQYMHISSDKNCFEVYHSLDYPYKR